MEIRWFLFGALAALCCSTGSANKLPVFTADMNNVALSENTPVGEVVYQLQGVDPDGMPITYGLIGTHKFTVDKDTGEVTLAKPLDREVEDTIKFLVYIEDRQDPSLVQRQPVTVIVLDENDNPPTFKNSPYEVDVPEDEKVGTTILRNIEVLDKDSVGDNLEVGCMAKEQWPEACDTFEVVTISSTANQYAGALVLKKPLNYNEQQFYQFQLYATDGTLNSTAHVEVKVGDVQNSPPVFSGSLTAALSEDAPVGTLVLTIKARDADRANPRLVVLELVTDPFDFFVLDSNTGELKTAKPLDREALEDPSSPLNVTVRASELVNGVPLTSDLTSSLATVTVTIKDVNDEAPRFNKREYYVEIPESLPPGTPLPNLDMVVTDRDVGLNSVFSLRLSDDMGAFIVEPAAATGSAAVTLRLNAPLDYEDPNQRKFILEVIAEEVHTKPPLSSKASVTITLTDVNDNAPQFDDEPYSASVPEAAPPGTVVAQYTPTDRDTGSFGTEGIVYELSGSGSQLFDIDERSGLITVGDCAAPGRAPCLDYETRKEYLLQLKATDDDGKGQMSVVSLQMSLTDSNDNPPVFPTPVYRASIDEDAAKFEPELQVQARDPDVTSELRYSIVDPADQPFTIDPLTGKISVRLNAAGVSNDNGNKIVLTVLATDEVHNATCKVEITVRDVNNHAPAFDQDKYDADIAEDAPIGTAVAAVRATDLDSGVNSEIKYFIQKGAQDAFAIDNGTGIVTVASRLDFDKRDTYRVQIVASDLGLPSLTGTTELSIHVVNVNDKKPYFTPAVQRAEVSADAEIGTFVHQLVADDPDIMDRIMLNYEINSLKPVGAVDDNGKDVSELGIFSSWFNVFPNGTVVVSQLLDRTNAAVISLPVLVTDTSAPVLQQTEGELIITIVDVNRNAPVFGQPSYLERMVEEQPVGTLLNTYTARDKETPISAIVIYPPSPYFDIDNVTGIVRTTHRIDYESTHTINFTLIAYDSGVPVRSGTAMVTVEVVNANDEEPKFAATEYDATVVEGANVGSRVVTVNAVDKDEGEFGIVTYSLTDSSAFTIDPQSGVITVARDDIDREKTTDFWMKAVATDAGNRSTSVPIHIKVLDVNDNPPVFTQKVYKSTIAENLQLNPPAAILQVLAEDKDEGVNGKVEYSIEEQTEPGAFTVDASTGILYPARQVAGGTTHVLVVRARDAGAGAAGAGAGGPREDTAAVHIHVLSVNKHAPVFVAPPSELKQLEIPENAAEADFLITTIKATDGDSGENGRVSYFLKVDNQNVGETNEFSLDKNSGELRTKTFLDRELKAEYQLVIVAADNGTPSNFETLRLLTVVLIDENDNVPIFEHAVYNFMLKENLPAGVIVGTVRATDKDSGENSKVYYHLLEGNEEGGFTLDRTQGVIRANVSFDREKVSDFSLTIYASNSPLLDRAAAILNSVENNTEGQENSVTTVKVKILDENDNEPKFAEKIYYAGVKYTARVNEPILPVVAEDPDLEENGTLIYMVAASNLFKFGASKSSGSVVPSPFNITQDGILMTASYMSEYHQDRFVLDVIAQEVAPPHRQATAQVYVWIIDRSSMIRMVLSRGCGAGAGAGAGGAGAGGAEGAAKKLAAAAGATLVPAATRPLHADRWCEVHMHAVSPTTWAVLPAERVLADIDARYDELSHVYAQYGVETLTAAAANRAPESFDPALAALTALLIVLFTGIVTFIVVCACLKHWVIPPPSLQSSKGDSLARRRILEELSTTENPLWLETKLRPYEEQELTMNVFGDQAEQLANVEQGQQTDNTYATIAGRTDRFGDYATLGGDSPTELEAALGFQGSTFKPPTPDTPEPPPRPSGLGVP